MVILIIQKVLLVSIFTDACLQVFYLSIYSYNTVLWVNGAWFILPVPSWGAFKLFLIFCYWKHHWMTNTEYILTHKLLRITIKNKYLDIELLIYKDVCVCNITKYCQDTLHRGHVSFYNHHQCMEVPISYSLVRTLSYQTEILANLIGNKVTE